jgi:ubiquinone/menaquinone biosynthesis C-methylase UbiE
MDRAEYGRMQAFEENYWWHVGRRYLFHDLLDAMNLPKGAKIVDIGCGSGKNMELFSRYGEVTGVDMDEEALQFCRERGFNNLILTDGTKLAQIPDSSFDLVTAIEVLEHIERDNDALNDWYRILKPGGRLLLSVPAYMWLFGSHDKALHHFRRYDRSSLLGKLRKQGFVVKKATYFVTIVFPALALYRLVSRNRPAQTSYVEVPNILNNFFSYLLGVESKLVRFSRLPFGSSIVVIAKKPNG